jgi:hypothetical protein
MRSIMMLFGKEKVEMEAKVLQEFGPILGDGKNWVVGG